MDFRAVLRDGVGKVLDPADEGRLRLAVADPVGDVEIDGDGAVFRRCERRLGGGTTMGGAACRAAAMSSWAAAIAISGRLEGHHGGGRLESVGRVGRKVPGST